MAEDCVFCKIARKEIPASIIYEDKEIIGFLDINPVNKGHCLIIPKKHYITLLDIPDSLLGIILGAAKKISLKQMKNLNAGGFNLLMSNFPTAQQEVPHAHLHIIPRFNNDFSIRMPHEKYEESEIEKVAEKIRQEIKG